MVSGLDLVHHGYGVVGIGDDGLAAVIEGELLSGKDILARALALGLEVACGG